MTVVDFSPTYNDFLDFLVEKATPQEILAYKPSEISQQRAAYLTEQNKSDALTSDEAAELEQILEFELLVSALKARALKLLSHKSPFVS